jgi:hypothetical protein
MRPWESVSAPERVSPPAGQAAVGGRATVVPSARFRIRLDVRVRFGLAGSFGLGGGGAPQRRGRGRRPGSAFRAGVHRRSPGRGRRRADSASLKGNARAPRRLRWPWRWSLLTEGGVCGREPARLRTASARANSLTRSRNIVPRHLLGGATRTTWRLACPMGPLLARNRHAQNLGITAACHPG